MSPKKTWATNAKSVCCSILHLRRVCLAAVLLLACAVAGSAQKAGYDLLETQPGAAINLSKIPGFSPAEIPLRGVPICACTGSSDTIMRREVPVGGKVPLRVVALFMKNSDRVTFRGQPVDLYITVNDSNGVIGEDVLPQPDPLPASRGTLLVHANGTFDSTIQVVPDVIVVPAGANVTDPATHLSHRRGPDVTLTSSGSPWTATPPAGYPTSCFYPGNGFYPGGTIKEEAPHHQHPVASAKSEPDGVGARLSLEYLRHDAAGLSTLGTISTSGTVTDRFGVGKNFEALTFASADLGYGPDLFYFLRHDPATGLSTFGTISNKGAVTDRFGVGKNFDALTFVSGDLGYGPNLFYFLRHDPATGFSTFGTISTRGAITDRFGVGKNFDALTFASANLGYGPDLFYFLRHDPATGTSTFGTISTKGAITDRFGVGKNFDALTFAPANLGYGPDLFYFLRHDPATGSSTFGTISTRGAITDRFGVGKNFNALTAGDRL